jgi:acetoin utilization protein AcuB
MLVGERMKHPVITTRPDTPIMDALNLMKQERIRRLPVVKNGKLVGIITEEDLLNASASSTTTLNVWELNYLLSKIKVDDVMTKEVKTVNEDMPIEDAARIMADNKIGGLPVMRGDDLVGIITETDLFKILLELMGAREKGVRLTGYIQEKPGELAKLTQAITSAGGNFLAVGTFAGDTPSNRMFTIKVEGVEEETLKEIVSPLVERITDIRYCCP